MFSIRWGFTAKNKIKTAFLLFSVLCLVLVTNLQERRLISRINENVTSIYEDRLVVGNYILILSNHLEEILVLLQSNHSDKSQKISQTLSKVDSINYLYEKTYLTDLEISNFQNFKNNCLAITNSNAKSNYPLALKAGLEAEETLKDLSVIQVQEGKSKLDEVLNITSTSSTLSYIEIFVIIIISILIQSLVLSTKPIFQNKHFPGQHLN